ncbi:MAG: diguanylate cyclase [Clostridia bacterium]|jgi:diguanylate cyclase (GGDEF)-like protein|nr:diguanylate cyclase [Clostridia bacterium]
MNIENKVINGKYKIKNLIGSGAMSYVYLAEDLENDIAVAIKLLNKELTSTRIEDIIRFKNEAATISKLDSENIIKIYEVGEYENTPYIVMEYFNGQNLKSFANLNPLSTNETLDIIIKISEALNYVHSENIIHRDLKPENILVSKTNETITIKIIDFGLAQVKKFMKSSEKIAGTFSYMSPEQTGVLKRNVTEQSDLYSLGIIFYELITGSLPFIGTNINSIIHQHIAKVPTAPSKLKPDVPFVLEKIILKLLEKEPKNRYQSAHGLFTDLSKYRNGQIDFDLGSEDTLKLNYKPDFIGREKEIAILNTFLSSTLNGAGNICTISGEAGCGKSRLLEEFRGTALKNKTAFLEGHCFQSNKKLPYSPFKDAIDNYIKYFKNHSEHLREEIKGKITKKFYKDANILLSFNPEIKELITLDNFHEININEKKYLNIIADFIVYISEIENGLILVIDDIHWADKSSITFFNILANKILDKPLFLIASYRENYESIKVHSLKFGKTPYFELKLTSLDKDSLNKLIANILYDKSFTTIDIANFIFNKSGGNPLFSIEILKHLISQNAIVKENQLWKFNNQILENLQIPSTVVDILIKKLSSLTDEEVKILSYIAIVGKKFDINLLFLLDEYEKGKIVSVIDKSISLHILEKTLHNQDKLAFTHDRIREAFCEKLSEKAQKRLHLKVAETLELKKDECTINDYYDLVYHYSNAGDDKKTIEYGFISAMKSKENFAYRDSLHYFLLIIDLLEEHEMKNGKLWFNCMENIAELYLLLNKTDKSIEIYNILLSDTKDNLKQASIFKGLCEANFQTGNLMLCEKYARQALSILGHKLPKENSNILALKVSLQLNNLRTINKDSKKYIKTTTLFRIYEILSKIYIINDIKKYKYTNYKLLELAKSTYSFKNNEILKYLIRGNLCLINHKYHKAKKMYFKALQSAKKINNVELMSEIYQNLGFLYEWQGIYEKSIGFFNSSKKILEKIGDNANLSTTLSGVIHSNMYLGNFKEVRRLTDSFFNLANKSHNNLHLAATYIYYTQYFLAQGELTHSEYYATKALDLSNSKNNHHCYFLSNLNLGILNMYKNNLDSALKYLSRAHTLKMNNNLMSQYTVLTEAYMAECYIEMYHETLNKKLLAKINKLSKKAVSDTKFSLTSKGIALRVRAEYYNLINETNRSEDLYLESINVLSKSNRIYELAISYYKYGNFLAKFERVSNSKDMYDKAYSIFKEIDSKIYLTKLRKILNIENPNQISNQGTYTEELKYSQKLSSIINLSQSISSILKLDELLEKTLSIAMEVSGAYRGYLMLYDNTNDKLEIKAQKNLNASEENEETYSMSIIKDVIEKEDIVLITDASEDYRYIDSKSIVCNNLKSVICVPLKFNNEITGVCYLDNPLSSSVFTEDDIDILKVIMTQAAISIENAKLYHMAITDGLTGLIIHKHFKYLLEREIANAAKKHDTTSLIMFDIDHFKHFNDTYGHQAGDEVLRHLSKTTKEAFRTSDIISRYGGEEFTVILPKTDSISAAKAAEKLRKKIEDTVVSYEGEELKVTISLGVATYPNHSVDMQSLIKASDTALYESKETGRNKVSVYNSDQNIVSLNELVENVAIIDSDQNFKVKLEDIVKKASTQGVDVSLLIFSIDNLEELTSTYTHHIKDNIYDTLSTEISRHFRQSDCLLKYSDEKFAFILFKTDYIGIDFAANKLKSLIEKIDFSYKNKIFKVTTSIGGATYPYNTDSIDVLEDLALKSFKKSRDHGIGMVTVCDNKKED